MKKFLTMAAAAVMAVCLFALSACGGASGTLSSYVSAVKKGDFETAAEYVYGGSIASSYIPDIESDEMYEYMYKQTAGKFKYSVEETSTNDDETTTTISISYSFYSFAALVYNYKVATSVLGGSKEESKSTVKECLDDMTEITGNNYKVVLVQNDEGDWVLEAATATGLLTLICL